MYLWSPCKNSEYSRKETIPRAGCLAVGNCTPNSTGNERTIERGSELSSSLSDVRGGALGLPPPVFSLFLGVSFRAPAVRPPLPSAPLLFLFFGGLLAREVVPLPLGLDFWRAGASGDVSWSRYEFTILPGPCEIKFGWNGTRMTEVGRYGTVRVPYLPYLTNLRVEKLFLY